MLTKNVNKILLASRLSNFHVTVANYDYTSQWKSFQYDGPFIMQRVTSRVFMMAPITAHFDARILTTR